MALPNGIVMAWTGTSASIPAGWSRVTALDANFPKGNLTTVGSTGGATTHLHNTPAHTHSASHSHVSADTSIPTDTQPVNTDDTGASLSHTHTQTYATSTQTSGASSAANSDTISNEPSFIRAIFIQSNGTTDISTGVVAWYDGASAPTGFTALASSGDKYLKGMTTGGDGGGTGGAASHTHTQSSHTHTYPSHTDHTLTIGTTVPGTAGSNDYITVYLVGSHTHAPSGTIAAATDTLSGQSTGSGSGSNNPPYYAVTHIKADAATAAPVNTIAIWTGTVGSIPAGWSLCNGTGTPNLDNRMLKGANGDAGGTGGANAHAHTYSHAHTTATGHTHTLGTVTLAGATGSSASLGEGPTYVVHVSAHTHTASTSGAAQSWAGTGDPGMDSGTAEPPFYTVLFIIREAASKVGPLVGGKLLAFGNRRLVG